MAKTQSGKTQSASSATARSKSAAREADMAFVRSLAEVFSEHGLTELDVEREYAENDSLSVRIGRGGAVSVASSAPAQAAPAAPAAAPAEAPPAAAAAADSGADPAASPDAVLSPMVGTVYLQAEPGAPAFVNVGDRVSSGDVVVIVEAMKTMNRIVAPHDGVVQRILVEDGAAVEYGTPLVIIG